MSNRNTDAVGKVGRDTTASDGRGDGEKRTEADSLDQRIREQMVVDVPDDAELLEAIGDAVEIVRGSWKIKLTSHIKAREPEEKVFTYLLGAYAANIASDGERPPTVTRDELSEIFGDQLANDIAWHGWVRTYDGYAEIRPECLAHATDELARRYGGGVSSPDDKPEAVDE